MANSQEMLLARVVHVIDPSNFWIQIGTRELFDRFSQLENQLQVFCDDFGSLCHNDPNSKGQCDTEGLEGGCFVVVKSKLQGCDEWRRAQIARQNLKKGTVDVLYLDYGTTEIVHLDQICCALPAYFFLVDHQAWKCELAGIKPIAKTWTSRAVKYFQQLTKDVLLQAAVVSYQAPFSGLSVALYINDGSDFRSVSHLMLEQEVALPENLSIVAEFASDVVQVLPQVEESQYDHGDDSSNYTDASHTDDANSYSEPSSHSHHDPSENSSQEAKPIEQETLSRDVKATTPCAPEVHESDEVSSVTDSEPESPDKGIPGFNLNVIFKTKSSSIDKIKEQKEDARRKAVTKALERDLEEVKKDITGVDVEEETNWPLSDYDIGKPIDHSATDVRSQTVAQLREAFGDPSWSPSMTEGHGRERPLLQEMKVTHVRAKSASPVVEMTAKHRRDGSESKPVQRFGDSPTSGERLESSLSKQLSKILSDGNFDDPFSLCQQVNQAVKPGGVREPWGLAVVIEVLLEEAVKVSRPQMVTVLNILDAYVDTPNFDVRLETVLRNMESRFVKPAFGKVTTRYSEFGELLGQLLITSRQWNQQCLFVTQGLVFSLLEKWAIYNRKGYQLGVQSEKTQSVFVECLEGVWGVAADTVREIDLTTYTRVQEWLQDKILANSLPRDLRERVLLMLLSQNCVRVINSDQVKPKTVEVDVQTEISSFHLPDPDSILPEDSSLFSHFDTEVEDDSPTAPNTKNPNDPSPDSNSQNSKLERFTSSPKPGPLITSKPGPGPFSQPWTGSELPKEKPSPFANLKHNFQKPINSRDTIEKLGSWAHTVNVGKKLRHDHEDDKDISGLKALALQTLNGEKYVFSGRFVQDLPPRFKKHLAPEQILDGCQSDPHFYRKKDQNESAKGLDYKTPTDFQIPEEYQFQSDSGEDSSSHGKTESVSHPTKGEVDTVSDNAKSDKKETSYYAQLGLGDFPSVKDILSKRESDSGSDRDTPTPRSVTPVRNTYLQTDVSEKAQTVSINLSSSPKQTSTRLNPTAAEWSPKSQSGSSARSSTPTSISSNSGSLQRKASLPKNSSKDTNSNTISSIVMNIFGDIDADGESDKGKQSLPSPSDTESEIEKPVISEGASETDGANTSLNVSEIASEVEEERSTVDDISLPKACGPASTVLPENARSYGFDDYDDDDSDDDGFFVSGFDAVPESIHKTGLDNKFKSISSRDNSWTKSDRGDSSSMSRTATISSSRISNNSEKYVEKSVSSQYDNHDLAGVDWKEMDFCKPLDLGSKKARRPQGGWNPGQRKCTLCGDTDHTVYSCKKKKSVIF